MRILTFFIGMMQEGWVEPVYAIQEFSRCLSDNLTSPFIWDVLLHSIWLQHQPSRRFDDNTLGTMEIYSSSCGPGMLNITKTDKAYPSITVRFDMTKILTMKSILIKSTYIKIIIKRDACCTCCGQAFIFKTFWKGIIKSILAYNAHQVPFLLGLIIASRYVRSSELRKFAMRKLTNWQSSKRVGLGWPIWIELKVC